MKNKKTIIAAVLLVAVLMLGIGYAAISNITLNITGTATASANQDNFKVKFTGTPTTGGAGTTVAKVTNDTNATITVSGLTKKGDTATATYTISNESDDLSAALSKTVSNSNEDYFEVTSDLAAESVAAKGTTTITVTVKLIKTPIGVDESTNVGVTITAAPVQP